MDKRFVQLDDGLDFVIKDMITKEILSDNGSLERKMNEIDQYAQKLIEDNSKYIVMINSNSDLNSHLMHQLRTAEFDNQRLTIAKDELTMLVNQLYYIINHLCYENHIDKDKLFEQFQVKIVKE